MFSFVKLPYLVKMKFKDGFEIKFHVETREEADRILRAFNVAEFESQECEYETEIINLDE